MKKIILFFALMVIPLLSFAQQISGYSDTKWGMTPDAVVSAEKGKAHIQATPDVFLYGKGLVKIDNISIGGDSYKVDFIFNARQKLVMVNVVSPEHAPEFVNQQKFLKLESLLTQKYGSPKYKDGHFKVVWDLGETIVSLVHLYIGGESYSVSVSYASSEITKKETENL